MNAVHADPENSSLWRRVRSSLMSPGVLFALIWQVFLVYPVLAVLNADAPTGWTILGLMAVAAFSVSYLVAFASPAVTASFPLDLRARREGTDDAAGRAPTSLGHLAVLILCAAGTAPAAGAHAVVTFLPFVACFLAAAWPLRRSIPVAFALIAAGVLTALAVGETTLFIPALLVVPVALSMIGTRIAVGISEREADLRRALGAAEERDRVGRDLHDVLGHTLTALTIRAQLADRLVETDPAAARRELVTIEELTRTALAEMRRTVSGTRAADPRVELAGVTESLRSAGMTVEVRGDPGAVPARHSALAAWTIREAGTNIVRHSGARRATLEFTPDLLRITDDGVGIDSPGAREDGGGEGSVGAGGQGLAGLRRRARDEGATLTVSTAAGSDPGADGAGTIVEVRWE